MQRYCHCMQIDPAVEFGFLHHTNRYDKGGGLKEYTSHRGNVMNADPHGIRWPEPEKRWNSRDDRKSHSLRKVAENLKKEAPHGR